MTPYEELEKIIDLLPDEGQTVTLTRRKGRLIVDESAAARVREHEAMLQEKLQTSRQRMLEESLFGHLVQANERLQHYSLKSFIFTLVLIYTACVALHVGLGWESVHIASTIGVTLASLSIYVLHERGQLKKRFVYHVCPELDRVLTERNIDKFQLLGIMKPHRDLAPLARAIARWTK